MSDATTASGDAAGEQEAIAGAQGGESAAESPAVGVQGGLASLADEGGEVSAPANWPDDWRERLAGKNDGFGKLLKRFASPENFAKSYTELRQKVTAPPSTPSLPEGATEEQIAEYRQAIGIPETPDGYGVAFAPEVGADENLNAMLQGFLAHAHARNLPPAAVKAAVEWQQQQIIQQREEAAAAAARERARVASELRKEYGAADYKRNLALADEFLEGRPGLAKLVRADNPDLELVRDIVALALDTAPEDRVFEGDSAAGGKSLDDQIEELTQKSIRGKLNKTEDEKYNRLLAARLKRDERKQSRAA